MAWPHALALQRFAGFVAAPPPFAEAGVAGCGARPDALALRRVAAQPPFAEPGFAVRRALLGLDVLPALLLPVLLLPALAASVLAHRHSMAVSLQPKSELLSIAKVFS